MEQKKPKKVYVIGHKNPDTDSICSAIAYANLKNQITGEKVNDIADRSFLPVQKIKRQINCKVGK